MSAFPAKILLFGEYSILQGSGALTLPYWKYNAQLEFFTDQFDAIRKDSNQQLTKFAKWLGDQTYLLNEGLQLNQFISDLNKGLYLNSTIPGNYGLGSSGALVAAIFNRYFPGIEKLMHDEQRKLMAKAESYFHGSSSGIDPLSCFLQQPLYLKGNTIKILQQEDLTPFLKRFYLVDSGQVGPTGNFVKQFLKNLKEPKIQASFSDYSKLVDDILKSIMEGKPGAFDKQIEELSRLQFKNFQPMIPETMHKLWQQGVEQGQYLIKLCGSGGGGYMLVYSKLPKKQLEATLASRVLELSV